MTSSAKLLQIKTACIVGNGNSLLLLCLRLQVAEAASPSLWLQKNWASFWTDRALCRLVSVHEIDVRPDCIRFSDLSYEPSPGISLSREAHGHFSRSVTVYTYSHSSTVMMSIVNCRAKTFFTKARPIFPQFHTCRSTTEHNFTFFNTAKTTPGQVKIYILVQTDRAGRRGRQCI